MAREFPAVDVDPEPIFVRSSETGLDGGGRHRGHRPGAGARRGRLRHRGRADRRPLAGAVPAPARRADAVRRAGVDAAGQAGADPRGAGGHRVRTRWRAQHHRARPPRGDEPAALHPGVHRRGRRGARRLRRARPHRSRAPAAGGDRRHRHRHRRAVRLRHRGNHAAQLRSTHWASRPTSTARHSPKKRSIHADRHRALSRLHRPGLHRPLRGAALPARRRGAVRLARTRARSPPTPAYCSSARRTRSTKPPRPTSFWCPAA